MTEGSMLFAYQNTDHYALLRSRLADLKYDAESICRVIGGKSITTPTHIDYPLLEASTVEPTPLNLAIRLFHIGITLSAEQAVQILKQELVDASIDAGILVEEPDGVRSQLRIHPDKGLFVAYDFISMLEGPDAAHWVMGIGASTRFLANMTPRNQVESTLDLCSGCGYHGMLAAAHSTHVTATDINPRAIAFAQFNARLNNLGNFSAYVGSLFEPVESQAFDLIVANPPFVISPSTGLIYRDALMRGDEFCKNLLRDAVGHMNEGAYCLSLLNWPNHGGNIDDPSFMAEWFADLPVDVLLLYSETQPSDVYAKTWINGSGPISVDQFKIEFEQWMSYYKSEGMTHLSAGTIILRKRSDVKNWFRIESPPSQMQGPADGDVIAFFENLDFLQRASDEDVLQTCFAADPGLQLNQPLKLEENGWVAQQGKIIRTLGFPFSGNSDALTAQVIAACDGQTPVSEIAQQLVQQFEINDPEFLAKFVPLIRSLTQQLFLHPR